MSSAYLSDGRYENYALTVGNAFASFAYNRDTYTVTPYYGAEMEAYIIAKNGVPGLSVTGEVSENEDEITFKVYQGIDLTAQPAFTIVLDTTPDKVKVPADVIVVDPATFVEKAEDFLF